MNKSIIVSIAFSSLLCSALPAAAEAIPSARLAGETRFETAIAVSQHMYPTGEQAPGAFLTRSDDVADAVSVAPLAKLKGKQPVLITPKESLHPGTSAELKRLVKPGGTITIVGGVDAVSSSVEAKVKEIGFKVQRIGGLNRSSTAATIADQINDIKPVQQVFIADMRQWQEGLFWSPIAAHHEGVVLLADTDTNAPETADWLKQHPEVKRVAGFIHAKPNPALTDAITATNFLEATVTQAFKEFEAPKEVSIATSAIFADALTAAAYMSSIDGPVLFADDQLHNKPLPSGLDTAIQTHKPSMVRVFGGPKAVSPEVVTSITDPNWQPIKQAAGNGCDAPKGQHLPDGVWYGFVVGGEGMPDLGEGNAVIELFYVCYYPDGKTWEPAKRWRNRLMWVSDRKVYQTMVDDEREDGIGEFTLRDNMVTQYRAVPNIKPLISDGIESCISDGCDYWEG